MNWLRKIFNNLIVMHEWTELDGSRRRCTVCGRLEEYDEIGSVNGSVWDTIWRGRPEAHRRPLSSSPR